MSQPVLDCPAEWVNDCGCPSSHNYCWPRPDTSCCDALQVDPVAEPERFAAIERVLRISVSILHGLTGRQFGLCPVTVRPCRTGCSQKVPPGAAWMTPDIVDGKWLNVACGSCTDGCSCEAMCEFPLPGRVEQIVEVTVDGVVQDPDTYRVDNHRFLVRNDVAIATDTAQTTTVSTNLFDAASAICTPSEPLGVQGWDPTGAVPPPYCFTADPSFGQLLTLPGGCNQFTLTVAPGDQTPLEVLGDGLLFAYPGGATLTAAAPFTVSQWRGNVRQRIRLISGASVSMDAGGVFAVMPPGVYVFEVCYQSRTFGGSGLCWPKCQDMSLPLGQVGTFGVTYRRGRPVPTAGSWSAGLLACELAKACGAAPGVCDLPANVKSVTREGVAIDFEQVNLAIEGNKGRTGIPEVDLWIQTVNPYGVTGRARAYSPDVKPMRTTTWPCND